MNKYDLIRGYVRGKIVLDLGCADYSPHGEKGEQFLHKIIFDSAKETLGIDCDEKSVRRMKKEGYNVIKDDCEYFTLLKEFEIIIAGELIEHLLEIPLFLESVHRHLKHDGLFILTTPNPQSITHFKDLLFGRKLKISKMHMSWQDINTITNLLDKHCFKIKKIHHIGLPINWKRFIVREKMSPSLMIVVEKK